MTPGRLIPWLLLIVAAGVYTWRLGDMPTYISPDEAIISVDAHAVATTGRDVHGNTMPLYFFIQMPNSDRTGWFTPVIFYLSAATQLVLPFAEWSVRVPSVLVGLANLLLIYVLALAVFGEWFLAVGVALLLAISPAHFIFSRYALDYLYPVPFVIGWLIAVHRAIDKPTTRRWMACGLWLGVGFFSYAAAILLTPPLMALTAIVAASKAGHWKRAWPVVAGYAIPVSLFVVWFAMHPTAFSETAARYAVYDPTKLNALQGLREFLSFPNVERMVATYWSFFNPSFLFLSGDQLITYSTRQAGAFPLMMLALMPLGLVQIVERERNTFAWLIVAGFVLAPLPAVIVSENGAMNRVTAMLPFAVVIAGYGLKFLWSFASIASAAAAARWIGAAVLALGVAYAGWTLTSEGRMGGAAPALLVVGVGLSAFAMLSARIKQGPMIVVGLLVIALLQFGGFTRDYFGEYRIRVNSWLGGNLRGALETLIARQPADGSARVYFAHLQNTSGLADIRNYFLDTYWSFYVIKHHRLDLQDRTGLFDPAAVDSLQDGSFVLGNKGDRVIDGLVASGKLSVVDTIPELDRDAYFLILQRRHP